MIAANVPYLLTLARLGGHPLNHLFADLGMGLANGWIALFAMAASLSSLVGHFSGGPLLGKVHLGWTLPGFWVPFGITLTVLWFSSSRIRHLTHMTKGEGTALWDTLVPSLCFVFLLVVFTIYASGE